MTEAYISGEFRVVQDVVVKEVGSTKVATVAGMVVESIGGADNKKEIVSYFDLEVWDRAAEFLEKNLKKGDALIVLRGTPRQNRWEKDGVKHSKVIFRVNSFKIVPKKDQELNG